jgi:hypothetical protein
VWLEVPPDRIDNAAFSLDLQSGEVTPLWTAGLGTNINDVKTSPDGRMLAYRIIQRQSPPPEAIMVRALRAGAEPLVVAATETDIGHLTGYAWSPDAKAMAYGRQIGHMRVSGGASSPVDRWELHIVRGVGDGPELEAELNDETIWSIDGDTLGTNALEVIGWDAEAGVAAVAETPGDGGAAVAVRLIDTEKGQEIDRVRVSVIPFEAAASPDARMVALPDATVSSGLLRVLQIASGELHEAAVTLDATPGGVIWSPDSEWVAWTAQRHDGPGTGATVSEIGAAPITGITRDAAAPAFLFAITGDGSRALSFDPSGTYILIAQAEPGSQEWSALTAHVLDDDSQTTLPWDPPPGAWFAAWVP